MAMILVIPTLHNQAAGRGLMLHGAGASSSSSSSSLSSSVRSRTDDIRRHSEHTSSIERPDEMYEIS
jgi:hypothetical protein